MTRCNGLIFDHPQPPKRCRNKATVTLPGRAPGDNPLCDSCADSWARAGLREAEWIVQRVGGGA